MGFTGVTGALAHNRTDIPCKQMEQLSYPLRTGAHFHITLACNSLSHTHKHVYTQSQGQRRRKKCAVSLKVTYLHSFMREPHRNSISCSEHF